MSLFSFHFFLYIVQKCQTIKQSDYRYAPVLEVYFYF